MARYGGVVSVSAADLPESAFRALWAYVDGVVPDKDDAKELADLWSQSEVCAWVNAMRDREDALVAAGVPLRSYGELSHLPRESLVSMVESTVRLLEGLRLARANARRQVAKMEEDVREAEAKTKAESRKLRKLAALMRNARQSRGVARDVALNDMAKILLLK